jgi:hypothetical protein
VAQHLLSPGSRNGIHILFAELADGHLLHSGIVVNDQDASRIDVRSADARWGASRKFIPITNILLDRPVSSAGSHSVAARWQ